MEELKLKGALIKQRTNCAERKLLFKTIANMIENKELLLPLYQTDLDNDKVSEMIESYKKISIELMSRWREKSKSNM
jgi:hypothetical protein